ncbi:D-glycero-beta-D-manno-heptose-7-phosphate kinase [Stella sp.]|uniref:D-glycero-beta-D-manno-heptose-7-phosphate kinase n=1 Tax=Stella sp. TaxID=2912054 RepID=UPI0035AE5EA9
MVQSADADLADRVEALSRVRVLCVGDVMLDRYIYGSVERISPEAPIPVLRIQRESDMLGGAGNVLRNLLALGTEVCFLSVVGDDPAGREIQAIIAGEERVEPHVLTERARTTPIKTRYVAGQQQLLRADRETVAPIAEALREDLIHLARSAAGEQSVVILSDYDKGVLRQGVAAGVIAAARAAGRTVVVDPKGTDYSRYRGANVLTPNRRELAEATDMPVGTAEEIVLAARRLIGRLDLDAVLVTRSQDGMTLVERGGAVHHLPAEAREVFDVSGAGDTVLAVFAAAVGAGFTLRDAARLGNVAAGLVVGKIGTAVAHSVELARVLRAGDVERGGIKALPFAAALDRVRGWRQEGLTIGFTNGCFDLLHPGHVAMLKAARATCDRLVVGLNSDASVARLKGPNRPVQGENARATVLASLADVDLVVIFGEDTPQTLIEAIRPDVLVKGSDYTLDQVVGADFVQSTGGRVVLVDLVPGFSTTATVAKLAG